MKLSSTKKTWPRKPEAYTLSSSLMIWSRSFVRGLRPQSSVMSQNSQLKGQPREYWMLIEA